MNSTDRQVLDAALRWAANGYRFALVTVARTWGSAPRPPGSWMALRDDGQVQGSVSGGCIEADLIERLLREGFASSEPYAVKYGVTQDEARRFGLPCGGTMELVIEPWPDLAALETLSAVVERGELARRSVVMGQEGSAITSASAADSLSWDGRTLSTLHGPAWRLLIIGAGQISSYLAQMAQALDYQVFICDPRSEYAAEWQVPGTTLLPGMPDDVVLELKPDPHTAVVALTHDPKLDDMALLEALKAPAFYVGALGSTLNNRRRRERLLEHFDLTADEVARLHGPVGLPIGSRTPPEIALAVLAEMTAVRNGVWSPDGLRPKRTAAEAGCRAA
ncbi:XdhC family protein [Pseudogulbenkiania subflava]|uniref:Xanthine dehydrogenase accessory factor n=1 Tax=Pseudogulbenkiania subflava DSM 22618 TaxID=1123014 RepID=A0A1Y6BZU4_9NEIS|nr:XdhC family protein [Pseudogulbenkiania subflava]SMF38409.1 xanthine dehydrogenase accessory factor [Pseudogulbenkiania subflava DSM 22618]